MQTHDFPQTVTTQLIAKKVRAIVTGKKIFSFLPLAAVSYKRKT